MASPTSSGTCDPPGASKKAKPPRSDENRARTASTSITVVLTCASLPRVERRALGGTGIEGSRLVPGCGHFRGGGSAPALFRRGGAGGGGVSASGCRRGARVQAHLHHHAYRRR